MDAIADTPQPPYYAVVFTSLRTDDNNGYAEMAERMIHLAEQQPGFLGVETVRDGLGITVSYWQDLADIAHWKRNVEHQRAQLFGRDHWYKHYKVRIAKVERDYQF